MIDYLATPEGSLVMWYGPKGLTWDYNEQGGAYFTELGQKTNQDPSFDMSGTTLIGPRTGTVPKTPMGIGILFWL